MNRTLKKAHRKALLRHSRAAAPAPRRLSGRLQFRQAPQDAEGPNPARIRLPNLDYSIDALQDKSNPQFTGTVQLGH